MADHVDLVFGLPYLWGKIKENSAIVCDEQGFGDTSLDIKWRLLEKSKFSLAFKPGVTLPSGNNEKGLDTGQNAALRDAHHTYRLEFDCSACVMSIILE